jgi:CheY-like chemotaxis protein
MDTFSLVAIAAVVLLVALMVWFWRRTAKTRDAQRSPSAADEASAPEGAFGAVVPESKHSTQAADTQTLSTQPPDFADTETGGPDTEQHTLPPELAEEESQDLLRRLQEAAALDAQEAEKKQAEQREKEEAERQAALARAQQEKKEAEDKAARLKALQEQALLAQATAAAQAEQLAAKERQAAEAAREKALLEKLRTERLERERLKQEQLEREQEQARLEEAAALERQAEIERQTQQAKAIAEAAEQQRLQAQKLEAERLEAENRRKKEEEEKQARVAAERESITPQPPTPVRVPHGRRAADIVVMVADDSKVVRVKASRLLTKHQYQVLLAEDGADAAAQMQATVPDILITDVEMPGMDGFELTRHVRSNARTAHIPVIMITAADDRHQAAAQEAGVNVLLGKPYEDEDLIERIRSTLRAA